MLRYLAERGVALGRRARGARAPAVRRPAHRPLRRPAAGARRHLWRARCASSARYYGARLQRAPLCGRPAVRRLTVVLAALRLDTPMGIFRDVADTPRPYTSHDVKDAPMTLIYRVDGMSCEHCVVAVTGEVGDVAGVAVGRRRPRQQARAGVRRRHRRLRGGRGDRRGRLRRGAGMSTLLKLAGFAVVLALVFGVAAVAGQASGPTGEPTAPEPRGGSMSGEHGCDGRHRRPVRGLAVSDDGLRLSLASTSLAARRGLVAALLDRRRRAARCATSRSTHEKRMHLIVVRRDGRGFQHLHPTLGADGVWSAPLDAARRGRLSRLRRLPARRRARTRSRPT